MKIGEIHLYADDTISFVASNTIDETVIALNILANEISDLCDKNCLTIHTRKTEALIITDKCFIGPPNQIKIKGQGILVFNESKALGVFIDQKLSWKKQVTTVRKSFNTKIKLLERLYYLPPNILERIYYKTIISSVTYCISVWGSCPPSTFNFIEAVHTKVARILHHMPQDLNDSDSLK